MSILQAVLLGIIYYLGNSSIIAGPVGYYSVYRPLVSGCLTGMILGDPAQGTMIGATINLMYVGFISAGGALPGDMCLAGILGAALGITGGLDTEAALAIAVPIDRYLIVVRTSDTGFRICTYGRSFSGKRRGRKGLDSFCIVAAADAVCAYLCSVYAGMLFRSQLYSGYY